MIIKIGDTAGITFSYNQTDFDRFARLSGDLNPIHVDPRFSKRSRFGRTVAHGMLLYSAISRVLGSKLPGPGTIQLKQELMFPTPTYAGEQLTVRVTVNRLGPAEGMVELGTFIQRDIGKIGCQGRAVVATPPIVQPYNSFMHSSPGETYTKPRSMKGLRLGQFAKTTRTFTRADLEEYVDLTRDKNPLYSDRSYARQLGFQDTPLPVVLLGGMISYLLGTELPGRGTNWLKQSFHYFKPAFPGIAICTSVEVVRLRPKKDLVNLKVVCVDPSGETVCEGEALVLIRDLVIS